MIDLGGMGSPRRSTRSQRADFAESDFLSANREPDTQPRISKCAGLQKAIKDPGPL